MQQGCQESHLSQTGEAGHLYRQTLDFRPLPYGQFLKSLRWGLPQSPVIASRAVRLCTYSGRFAVTGRNKKSEARRFRSISVLPCLFSSVLVYFLLPVLRRCRVSGNGKHCRHNQCRDNHCRKFLSDIHHCCHFFFLYSVMFCPLLMFLYPLSSSLVQSAVCLELIRD